MSELDQTVQQEHVLVAARHWLRANSASLRVEIANLSVDALFVLAQPDQSAAGVVRAGHRNYDLNVLRFRAEQRGLSRGS